MRILLIAVAALALAACSNGDFERLTSYLPLERPNAQQQAPAQQPMTQFDAPPQTAPAATAGKPVVVLTQAAAPAPRAVRGTDNAAHCKAVAAERASDGALMGYDDDLQKTEYDGAYASCMAWFASHGGSSQ